MASEYDIIKTPPKALTFDVFGTVVDVRATGFLKLFVLVS